MQPSPDPLEKIIHQTLRSLPPRRAPRSLETRVRAALEARAARPWWKQSFARWPLAARVAFFIGSAGVAKLALMATVWTLAGFDGGQLAAAFSTQFAWIQAGSAIVDGVGDFFGTLYRSIPALWLYGGLAFVATLYVTLFGLAATAYRTLYVHR